MVFDLTHRWARRLALGCATLLFMAALSIVPSVSAQLGTPAASPLPTEPAATLPPAWLQFGPDGRLIARVIVNGECPALAADEFEIGMTRRAPPSDDFPVVACEATVPFGTMTASVRNQVLPLPAGPIRRIAVIGDTGCRLNNWEKKYQACDDPEVWPFGQVALAVADWDPDLIVHVGDYLYRESPCPEGMAGCQGNPYGDNWATWNADFFTPAAHLPLALPRGYSFAPITRPAIETPSGGLPSSTRVSTSPHVSDLPSPT